MARPLLLVENFFSAKSFPDHEIIRSSQAEGREGFRVGAARRTPVNFWTPATDNAVAWVGVDCLVSRPADTLVIDRHHNLGGLTVRLERSTDGFDSNVVTVREFTVPTTESSAETALADIARTREGAVLLSFTSVSSRWWRLWVPAMGADLRPRVTGLYLGASWVPEEQFERPWGFGDSETVFEDEESPTGWQAAAAVTTRRVMELQVRLSSFAEYDVARPHIEDRLLRRHPAWIVMDQDFAERSWMGQTPRGRSGLRLESGWGYKQGAIPLVEYQARLD